MTEALSTGTVIEVTDENFEAEFAHIQKVIFESAFAAMDMEFTGLEAKSSHKAVSVDTFETRYAKMKQGVESFFPLQLGLSCFKFNEKESRWDATVFVFYLSPYSHSSLDEVISIRPGTIAFLKSNNFDFNKSFIHGISSLRRDDEKRLLDEIANTKLHTNPNDKIEVTQSNVKTLKVVIDRIQQWLEIIQKGSDEERQALSQCDGKYYLVLDPVNAYYRRLIYQEVEQTYGSLLTVVKLDEDNQECKKSSRRLRVIFNSSADDQKSTKIGVQELRIQEVTKLVGIRRVLELISGKHLPLIGFEMMNDLMFLYHWCIDRLPETCSEFLRRLRTEFPLIVDVRNILRLKSLLDMLPDSLSLENIYKSMQLSTPKVQQLNAENKQAHNAGYDAYMTGDVLLHIATALGLNAQELSHLENFWNSELPQDFVNNSLVKVPAQFQAEMNTVNLYNIPYGLPLREDLFGLRQKELRENGMNTVLLASDFPLETKTSHWLNSFRDVLIGEEKLQVIWINDCYCLLKFASSNSCEAGYQLWDQGRKGIDVSQVLSAESLKIPFYQFKLYHFDEYERVCGVKVTESTKMSVKRDTPTEDTVVFESKRYRITRIHRNGSSKGCSIYCCVCFKQSTNAS